MMILVARKQSCSEFSEQLDFFRQENSMKLVLLKFYLLHLVSMVKILTVTLSVNGVLAFAIHSRSQFFHW